VSYDTLCDHDYVLPHYPRNKRNRKEKEKENQEK